jgi:hypothetical protein
MLLGSDQQVGIINNPRVSTTAKQALRPENLPRKDFQVEISDLAGHGFVTKTLLA